jgi:2-alkenal reductase
MTRRDDHTKRARTAANASFGPRRYDSPLIVSIQPVRLAGRYGARKEEAVDRARSIFSLGLTVGLIAGTLGAGRLGIGVWAQDGARNSAAQTEVDESVPVQVVERVSSAVVTVLNEQTVEGVSEGMTTVGSGTGFIIDDDGHIVTNWHVITGGEEFEVIFADGKKKPATLVGFDQLNDLAVVKVSGDVPGVVAMGDSDALEPGQAVLAIGSPLGSFTNTVTQGIVSATHRSFPGSTAGIYTDLVQHDAAINPGNSGGPLFNMAGEVVGVNTLGIPEANGQPVQGLFFAIPSNTVDRISQRLIDEGTVSYPYFGVAFVPVTPEVVAQLDLSVDTGVLVTEVSPGGPADEAGIEAGDVILSIDGQEIDEEHSFGEVLFSHEPGETVDVVIQRDDLKMTVNVELSTRPLATGQ